MRKLITFFVTALICCSSLFAANIGGGTKLYLTPNANWKQADARFAAYYFGNSGNAWASMTPVSGETDLYAVVAPAGTWTNVIFCRMNPASTENNWNNKWNQTSDLTYDGTKNHYTIASGAWDNGAGTWSVYTPVVTTPAAYLTAPSKVFIDEQITFSATSEYITDPVYTYSAKIPGSDSFVPVTSPYQPTITGTYTIKVDVAKSSSSGDILATDSKDVIVKDIPADITIKVKKPTDWEQISFYNWSSDVSGNFVSPILEGEWYAYTFTRMDDLNIIFVNGNSWDSSEPTTEEEAKAKFGKQTIDIKNVIESTCYEITEATYVADDPDWGKRRVKVVPCSSDTKVVYLSIPTNAFINEEISFSATSDNITDPVYIYSVKTPESESFVTALSPYTPTAVGTYTFKVEVAESTSPGTILATDSKDVIVKDIPADITIKVKKPTEWASIFFYNWADGIDGNFATPTLDGEWYSYTFERIDAINVIFVNKNEWVDQIQTVNIESIIESTCYNISEEVDGEGKKLVNAVDCGPITNTSDIKKTSFISVKNNIIRATFEGAAQINLYSINGQLIHSENAVNEFSKTLQNGVYLLRINNKTHKLIIQ